MDKRKIDLSFIKEDDLDKTSSFTDLMTRSERRKRKLEKEIDSNSKTNESSYDIEDMINEKRRTTKDLTNEIEQAKKEIEEEEKLAKTQLLELTRQMKFNFEEKKEENNKKKKKWVSPLNIIGEVNLLCIGYYIYLLAFTNYQDEVNNYLIQGTLIVALVLLFGLSVVTSKKVSKFFNILNILTILGFIIFNLYTLLT